MLRIGIDLGGTKIEGVVLGPDGEVVERERVPTPQGDYEATVAAVVALIRRLESAVGEQPSVGIGTPGTVSAVTGLMKNCNSTCLNGRALREDIEALLGREVRMANDADCLALSEASDGAGAGAHCVFAVILGTGVGGGIVVNGQLVRGVNGIAGEWGHNPLPGIGTLLTGQSRVCYCGRHDCIETWLSGPGLSATYEELGGGKLTAQVIASAAAKGDSMAAAALALYQRQLAAALGAVVNLLDPGVIVLGGGLSNVASLYRQVPAIWQEFIFSDSVATRLLPAKYGDASGVRGAARLW